MTRFSEHDLEEISAERFASFSDIRPQLARDLLAANGELERLRAAVKLAEDTFKWYGDLHAAKPDMEKAHRNYELAQHMATALQGDAP